jgi:hypothetical protein
VEGNAKKVHRKKKNGDEGKENKRQKIKKKMKHEIVSG